MASSMGAVNPPAMDIDTEYVILQNDMSREPCSLLQMGLLEGVPRAKIGCCLTSGLTLQCSISARRGPQEPPMALYSRESTFPTPCPVSAATPSCVTRFAGRWSGLLTEVPCFLHTRLIPRPHFQCGPEWQSSETARHCPDRSFVTTAHKKPCMMILCTFVLLTAEEVGFQCQLTTRLGHERRLKPSAPAAF